MWQSLRLAASACGLAGLVACAGVPLADSRAAVERTLAPQLAAARGAVDGSGVAAVDQAAQIRGWLAAPLDAQHALDIALLRNPQVRVEYARLGLTAADVYEARRLANPSVSLGVLSGGGGVRRVDAGVTLGFTDLLWLHARRRLAGAQLLAEQQRVAAAIFDVALDVQRAWLEAVASAQWQAIRAGIVEAASASAELAQAYRKAGNIDALALLAQQVALSEAQLAEQRSAADLARARAQLQQAMGLSAADGQWQLPSGLPDLDATPADAAALRAQAHAQRLDLQAADTQVEAARRQLASTRHLRWFASGGAGEGALGAQGERENGVTRTGPALTLVLPLFQQGQGAVARAAARLEQAEAQRQQLAVQIDAELDAQVQQLTLAQRQFALYRDALIPQHEQLVQRLSEQQSFALIGPFEGLMARQQQYQAYAGAIEAAQDYWRARIELARIAGAPLPALKSPDSQAAAQAASEVQP